MAMMQVSFHGGPMDGKTQEMHSSKCRTVLAVPGRTVATGTPESQRVKILVFEIFDYQQPKDWIRYTLHVYEKLASKEKGRLEYRYLQDEEAHRCRHSMGNRYCSHHTQQGDDFCSLHSKTPLPSKTRTYNTCPKCGWFHLRERKVKKPRWVCGSCKHEFEKPKRFTRTPKAIKPKEPEKRCPDCNSTSVYRKRGIVSESMRWGCRSCKSRFPNPVQGPSS